MSKLLIGILLWLVAGAVRFILFLAGIVCVAISMIGDGQYRTPRIWKWCADMEKTPAAYTTSWWKKYKWNAWRNPLEGLDKTFSQPIPEIKPNPDDKVRGKEVLRAKRFMQHEYFWEYWSLSRITRGPWKGRFWEFRIGWKFVDGNEDFVPTFQIGPKR